MPEPGQRKNWVEKFLELLGPQGKYLPVRKDLDPTLPRILRETPDFFQNTYDPNIKEGFARKNSADDSEYIQAITSPYSVMQNTYGDATDSVLQSRAANDAKIGDQISDFVRMYMPGYDKNALSASIPVYSTRPDYFINGAGGMTSSDKEGDPMAVTVPYTARSDKDLQSVLDHEMVHVNRRARGKLRGNMDLDEQRAEYNKFYNEKIKDLPENNEYKLGYKAVARADELPAYATEVVRTFYRDTKRLINSEQDARDAIENWGKRVQTQDIHERGKYEGLKRSPAILQLLQTLAKNKNASSRSIG